MFGQVTPAADESVRLAIGRRAWLVDVGGGAHDRFENSSDVQRGPLSCAHGMRVDPRVIVCSVPSRWGEEMRIVPERVHRSPVAVLCAPHHDRLHIPIFAFS